MPVPSSPAVLEFIGQQQKKLLFLQKFKRSLDEGHSHYQAFTESLQFLNAALWLKFVAFIQGSQTKSEQVVCQAIQEALAQYIAFPSVEAMEAWVEGRLTQIGKERALAAESSRGSKQKRRSSTRKNTKQSTEKSADPAPIPMAQPMFPQLFPQNAVDPFKAQFPVNLMTPGGIRHPIFNPITGQMPSFIQSTVMQNQTIPTGQNGEENANH